MDIQARPAAAGGAMSRQRIMAGMLALSTAGMAGWIAMEGYSAKPYIPTKGDVPTIGHGSTRYEDGAPVRMTDPPISRTRAAELAANLFAADAKLCWRGLESVPVTQVEYDTYSDFCGQFGVGNFQRSRIPRLLKAGRYSAACDALLLYKYQGGRDCSLPASRGPDGCSGVWSRQLKRHAACVGEQG